MIFQLEEGYLDRLENQLLPRRLQHSKKLIRRYAKAKQRRLRSLALAWYRRQYFLSHAHRDLRVFTRQNEDIALAVMFVIAALGYTAAAVSTELAFTFFLTAYTVSELSGASMLLLAAAAAGTLIVSLAWMFAFLFNSLAVAIMQGANRTKLRTLRATLRRGLQSAGRTSVIWLLLLTAVSLPALAALIATVGYLLIFADKMQDVIAILPYSITAAIGGAVLVLLVYGIAPIVGLFEHKLSYRQVFSRSKSLLRSRGKLFLFAGYLAMLAVIGVAYGLAVLLNTVFGLSQPLTMSIVLFAAAAYSYGIMTVFYRKRRLARS